MQIKGGDMSDIVEQAREYIGKNLSYDPKSVHPRDKEVTIIVGLLSRLAEVEKKRDSANERLVEEVEASRLSEKRITTLTAENAKMREALENGTAIGMRPNGQIIYSVPRLLETLSIKK